MRILCLVLLAICIQASDLRISEVMSNPQGSEYENEFVEVFNASGQVMQINGWILSDGNGVDTIAHLSGPMEILAGRYALIMDPGYDFASGPYVDVLNDSVPLYTIITDASFGSGGLSNAGESVIIRSPDSLTTSRMSWSSSTTNGFSWERVSVFMDDSLSVWEQSHHINGTPGYRNSVTPPLINVGITDFEVLEAILGELVQIRFTMKNTGENSIPGFSVSVYLDQNQNNLRDVDEWEVVVPHSSEVNSQDVIEVPISLFVLTPGVHQLEARLMVANDEVAEDDSLRLTVMGPYPRDVVSITEVMYSPSSDQHGEWVEIQNRSDQLISFQGWTFSDANQTRHAISDTPLLLDSYQYLTLCASESMADYFGLDAAEIHELDSWPALNSSSDSIRLFDATGGQISSAFYRGSWGETATSLERRHPACRPFEKQNWAASTQADGGTPSRMNTQHLLPVKIHIEDISLETAAMTGPAQAEVRVSFQNVGMDTLYILELDSDADIFWMGVLPSFESDSLIFTSPMLWPGYSQIPIRILHNDEILADTSVQVTLGFSPGQIAINEIHYVPHEDQTEFLEFINIGSSILDLRGWRFRDRSGAQGEVTTQMLVPPDSLFLWTGDGMRLADWSPSTAQICELSAWPSLNNSSDSIIILDPLGQRMLAHGYEATHNEPGKSLERVALWKPSEAESSWSLCQDPLGITPGRHNSIRIPPWNLALHDIAIMDSMLWIGEHFTLRNLIVNAGVDLIENAQIEIEIHSHDVEVETWWEILPPLWAGDTLVWDVEVTPEVAGWFTLEVEAHFPEDESLADNRLNKRAFVSRSSSPLVINEIMPLPLHDENEWLEIYNRFSGRVDLAGWLISDNSNSRIGISDSSLFIEPFSYLVIGGDQPFGPHLPSEIYQGLSSFPTLNNSADQISLFDPQGVPMDIMSYGASTGLQAGRSLERIRPERSGDEPENWSVCIGAEGATPGEKNSLYLDVLASQLDIELDPNPFSPNGDGYADHMIIQYELPFERGLMSIEVFDMAGRKIADPVQVKPVSHRGEVIWDGEASYGGKAATGLYIMKLLFDDQGGKVWSKLKKVYLIR